MAASTSQNRCVFVGNIPYDATEEQLIQICEEVGPVVSFRQIVRCDMPKEGILNVAWINRRLSRATLAAAFEHTKHRIRGKGVIPEEIYYVKLVSKDTKSWTNLRRDALFLLPYEFRLVTDRETGKPKGYGFCEYKDEETALSARRNLLGYEINGRQLRVDFAENDKGADKNREQGRGGPGMATANVDPQKQVGGPAILVDSAHQQPIGLSLATAAGSIMAGALGGAQTSRNANLNPVYSQGVHGVDPLTLHLAQMSRAQLNDIFSELKVMATENKELARQLLLANPQLPKALFQAQIMLGMVTPQMMANIQQRGSLLPQVPEDNQHDLPPVAQNKMQFGIMPTIQEGQPSAVPPQRVSQVQMPNEAPIHFQQPLFPAQSGVSSIDPNLLSSFLARPQVNATGSSYLNQQTQVPSLQHSGMYGTVHSGHDRQLVNPNEAFPPRLIRPPESDPGYKAMRNTSDRLGQATIDTNLVQRTSNYSNLTTVSSKRPSMVADNSEPRPSEQIKLNGRKETVLGSSQVLGLGSSVNKILIPQNQPPEPEASQVRKLYGEACNMGYGFHLEGIYDIYEKKVQLPTEVESALLQQVMNLTPEQLSLLPPDQKQQVLQLQQMLR